MTKEMLRPGMIVELRIGENAIVAVKDTRYNSLMICWGNTCCLPLDDYHDDLRYGSDNDNDSDYDINIVYDVGPYSDPFSMDLKCREKLWERDKICFSFKDRMFIAQIADILNQAYSDNKKHYFIEHRDNKLIFTAENILHQVMTLPDSALYGFIPQNTIFDLSTIIESKK